MGDQKLFQLHVWFLPGAVRDRDCVDGKGTRPIGYLIGLSGITYLVQGWVLGSEGFSSTNTVPTLLGYILVFAWSIWLLILAWRMKESVQAAIR